MRKFLIPTFLLLVFAVPALAKSVDVYPVSCDDLWAAVKDTLANTNNYGVAWMDDLNKRASFVVIGDLTQYTERVALVPQEGGCWAKARVLEVGPADDEWRQFQHRIAKSLAKLQAAKPKAPAPVPAPEPAPVPAPAPAPGSGQP